MLNHEKSGSMLWGLRTVNKKICIHLFCPMWLCECNEVQEHPNGCIICKSSKRVFLRCAYFAIDPIPWICTYCNDMNSSSNTNCRRKNCPGMQQIFGVCQCTKLAPRDEDCQTCGQLCTRVYLLNCNLPRNKLPITVQPQLPNKDNVALPGYTYDKSSRELTEGYDELKGWSAHLVAVSCLWIFHPERISPLMWDPNAVAWSCLCSNESLATLESLSPKGLEGCLQCHTNSIVYGGWFSNVPVNWECSRGTHMNPANSAHCSDCQRDYGLITPKVRWRICKCPEIRRSPWNDLIQEPICEDCKTHYEDLYELPVQQAPLGSVTIPAQLIQEKVKDHYYCATCQSIEEKKHDEKKCQTQVPVWCFWKRVKREATKKAQKVRKPSKGPHYNWHVGDHLHSVTANPRRRYLSLTNAGVTEEEWLQIAILESQESKDLHGSDEKAMRSLQPVPPTHAGQEALFYRDKKQDYSQWFHKEKVVESSLLPWLCSTCGYLNPRGKPPLFPGWGMMRHFCATSTKTMEGFHERSGFWECPRCTVHHPLKPYDFRYNPPHNVTDTPYPLKRCNVCEYEPPYGQEVKIMYQDGIEMTVEDEQSIVSQMKREFYFQDIPKSNQSKQESHLEKELDFLLESKSLVDPTLLALPPRTIQDILFKCDSHAKPAAMRLALWFSLHKRISIVKTEDDGQVLSLWPHLARWLKWNPIVEEIWRLGASRHQLGRVSMLRERNCWILVAQYVAVFGAQEDRLHYKWLQMLGDLGLE